MLANVTLLITAQVNLKDFPSTEDVLEHVASNGDIERFSMQPCQDVPLTRRASATTNSPVSAPAVAAPAQPASGGNNPGSQPSEVSLSSEGLAGAQKPRTDLAATSPSQPSEGVVKPVSITEIRAVASAFMAKDPANKPKVAALLKQYGVNNMTALGEQAADVITAFYTSLKDMS